MDKLLTMKIACERLGVTTKTIQRWDALGKIHIVRTPGGRRRIPESEVDRLLGYEMQPTKQRKIALYARVSSNEQKQKGDLERQIHYLQESLKPPFLLVASITDVGSGLNDKRKGLLKLMKLARNGDITDIYVRYKDRLTRFGYTYLEEYFKSHGVTIRILDQEDQTKNAQEELVDDLIGIITSFSGKLYGLRSKKHKELKQSIEEAIVHVPNVPNEIEERNDRSSNG